MLRYGLKRFSTELKASETKLKATPKAGFKMPKLKDGQEIIGFRPHCHTDILGKTKNFNFEMQRQNHQTHKNYGIAFIVFLSMIPIGLFISNAEGNFRKAQVKQISSKRRDRLDKEHGIDRKALQEDYKALDEEYRLTEKEEIKKYLELGKTPQQYYDDRKAYGKADNVVEPKPSMETLRETLLRRESDGMEVNYI